MLGDLAGIIVVSVLFGIPGIWFLGKTPIGHAIIQRLTQGQGDPEVLAEVDELRARLHEVEERLDFAERQLVSGTPIRPTVSKSEA